MNKKTVGTILSGDKTLKSFQKFISPYFRIRKINKIIQFGVFLVGIIFHIVATPPTAMYVVVLGVFFGCLFLDILWFDRRDHRVYIDQNEIAIKTEGILIKYKWAEIESFTRLPNSAIRLTLIDGRQKTFQKIQSVEELIALLKNRLPEIST